LNSEFKKPNFRGTTKTSESYMELHALFKS